MDSLSNTSSPGVRCTSFSRKRALRKTRCGTQWCRFYTTLSLPLFSYGLQRSSLIVPLDGYANAMNAMENGNPRAAAKLAKELLSTLPSTVNEAIGDGMDIMSNLKAISHTAQLYAEALKDSKLYTTETINAYENACQWMEYLYGINGGYTTRCLGQYETLLDTMGRYIEAEGLRTRIRLRKTLTSTTASSSSAALSISSSSSNRFDNDDQVNGKIPSRLDLASTSSDHWNTNTNDNEDDNSLSTSSTFTVPPTTAVLTNSLLSVVPPQERTTVEHNLQRHGTNPAITMDDTINSPDLSWYDNMNDSDGYINVLGDIVRGYLYMDNDTKRLTVQKLKYFTDSCHLDIHREVPEYARILLNEISTFTDTDDTLRYLRNKLTQILLQLEGKTTNHHPPPSTVNQHQSTHPSVPAIESGIERDTMHTYDETMDASILSLSDGSFSSTMSPSSSTKGASSSKPPPINIPTSGNNRYRNIPRSNNPVNMDTANSIPTIITSNKNGQNTVTYAGIKSSFPLTAPVNDTGTEDVSLKVNENHNDTMLNSTVENVSIVSESSSVTSSSTVNARTSLGIHVTVPQGAAKIWRPDHRRTSGGENTVALASSVTETTDRNTDTNTEADLSSSNDGSIDSLSSLNLPSVKISMQESWEFDPLPPTYESRKTFANRFSSKENNAVHSQRRSTATGISRLSPYRRHKLIDQLRVVERFLEILPIDIHSTNNDKIMDKLFPFYQNPEGTTDNTAESVNNENTIVTDTNHRTDPTIRTEVSPSSSPLSSNFVTTETASPLSIPNAVNEKSTDYLSFLRDYLISVNGMITFSLLSLLTILVWLSNRTSKTDTTPKGKPVSNGTKSVTHGNPKVSTASTSSSGTASLITSTIAKEVVSLPKVDPRKDDDTPTIPTTTETFETTVSTQSSLLSTVPIVNPSSSKVSVPVNLSSKKKKSKPSSSIQPSVPSSIVVATETTAPAVPVNVPPPAEVETVVEQSETILSEKIDTDILPHSTGTSVDDVTFSSIVPLPPSSLLMDTNVSCASSATILIKSREKTPDTKPSSFSVISPSPKPINNKGNDNVSASPNNRVTKSNSNVTILSKLSSSSKVIPSSTAKSTTGEPKPSSQTSSANPKISQITIPPTVPSSSNGSDTLSSGSGAMPTLASIVTANLAMHAPFTLSPTNKAESIKSSTENNSSSAAVVTTKNTETNTNSPTKSEIHRPSSALAVSSTVPSSNETSSKTNHPVILPSTTAPPVNSSVLPSRSSVEPFNQFTVTKILSHSSDSGHSLASVSSGDRSSRDSKKGQKNRSMGPLTPVPSSSSSTVVPSVPVFTAETVSASEIVPSSLPTTTVQAPLPFQPPLPSSTTSSVMYVSSPYPPGSSFPYYSQHPSPSTTVPVSMVGSYPPLPPLPTQQPPVSSGTTTMYPPIMHNPHYPSPYAVTIPYNNPGMHHIIPSSYPPPPPPMNMMVPYYSSPHQSTVHTYPTVYAPSGASVPSYSTIPSSTSVGIPNKQSTDSETGSSNGSVYSSSVQGGGSSERYRTSIHRSGNNGSNSSNNNSEGSVGSSSSTAAISTIPEPPSSSSTTIVGSSSNSSTYTIPYPPSNIPMNTIPTMIHADHYYGYTNGNNGVGWYLLGPVNNNNNTNIFPFNGSNPIHYGNNGGNSSNNSSSNSYTLGSLSPPLPSGSAMNTTTSSSSTAHQFTIPHVLTTTTTTTTTTVTTPTGTSTSNGFSNGNDNSSTSNSNEPMIGTTLVSSHHHGPGGSVTTATSVVGLPKPYSNNGNQGTTNDRSQITTDQHNTSSVSKNSGDDMDPTV